MKKYPVHVIVVDSDGEILVSTNGELGGPLSLVKKAKQNAAIMKEVRLIEPFGRMVTADLNPENPLGIVAALMSVNPGRSRILECPSEVSSWLAEDSELYGEPETPDEIYDELTGEWVKINV